MDGRVPKLVREAYQARETIMAQKVEKTSDQVVALLRDPRGKEHTVIFPKSVNDEKVLEVTTLMDGYRVSLKPVPRTNGYNTEFIITATKNGQEEIWDQMAIRYTSLLPEYRELMSIVKKLKAEKSNLEDTIISVNKQLQNAALARKKLTEAPKKDPQKLKNIVAEQKRLNILLRKSEHALGEVNTQLPIALKKSDAVPNKFEDFSYTPYSQRFNTPEVRDSGFRYLNESVKKAWLNPKMAGYKTSLGVDGKLAAQEAFPREIGLTLAIVERMDFVKYLSKWNPDTKAGILRPQADVDQIMKSQIERAITMVGLNRETTFNFQRSEVGAL